MRTKSRIVALVLSCVMVMSLSAYRDSIDKKYEYKAKEKEKNNVEWVNVDANKIEKGGNNVRFSSSQATLYIADTAQANLNAETKTQTIASAKTNTTSRRVSIEANLKKELLTREILNLVWQAVCKDEPKIKNKLVQTEGLKLQTSFAIVKNPRNFVWISKEDKRPSTIRGSNKLKAENEILGIEDG